MTAHDSSKLKSLNNLNAGKRIIYDFNDDKSELEELVKSSGNSSFIKEGLLYKLAKEREETNKILHDLSQKIVKLQEMIEKSSNTNTKKLEVLSEPDQHIIQLVEEQGTVTAQDIKERLSYKNSNAASQRLNRLVRDGTLKKIRSGRKVFFTR